MKSLSSQFDLIIKCVHNPAYTTIGQASYVLYPKGHDTGYRIWDPKFCAIHMDLQNTLFTHSRSLADACKIDQDFVIVSNMREVQRMLGPKYYRNTLTAILEYSYGRNK